MANETAKKRATDLRERREEARENAKRDVKSGEAHVSESEGEIRETGEADEESETRETTGESETHETTGDGDEADGNVAKGPLHGDSLENESASASLTRRAFVGGLSAVGVGAGLREFSEPASAAGEAVHFQYFHETWPTITGNLSKVADRGYDAIWIQAPQKSDLTWEDQGGRNDPPLGYQPVDYTTFGSEFGTEADLRALVDEAHNQGLAVYADCVMNHMATGHDYDFPRFSYDDFHHDVGSIDDWNDDHQVEHGELLGLPDLAQYDSSTSDYVRGELLNYMEKIASFGIDGYRYDAVKHVEEKYWRDYANPKADELGMARIGEVYTGSVDYAQGYIDTGMDAFDYPLFWVLHDAFSGGDLSQLQGAGVVAQDPWHAHPFVQNHDEGAPDQYHLAHAFALTIEGTPMVYNLYPNAILDDDAVNNMVWVKKNLAGGATYWRHSGTDLAVYERYGNLLVGINNNGSDWRSEWVYTSWTDTTLHDYSGTTGDVTTNGDGWVELSVPPEGWVFYAPY